MKELIEKLTKLGNKIAWDDDPEFVPDDYAGGNIDDAFYGGKDAGEIDLAREILKELTVLKV